MTSARNLVADGVCGVGHAIYSDADLTDFGGCLRCALEMAVERQSLREAEHVRKIRKLLGR